jgi:hypothetical protein
MGVPTDQRPAKLVASIIFKDESAYEPAEKELIRRFGPLEPLVRALPFDFTDYYSEEFGKPLKRKLLCFKNPVKKEAASGIKIVTNRIEDRCRKNGRRTVNIDPGYVTEAKLVLMTTKDYTHRVYIGNRIFAESTLHFQEGSFRPWPWTYPDYASAELISYFNEVRELYLRKGRGKRNT